MSAHRVAQEHGEKIDDLIAPEATPREAHPLRNLSEYVSSSKILSDDHRLLEYVIMPLFLIVWHIEAIREAVFHLLLSNRSSRACLWPGVLPSACPFSTN
jgi:hypothetical protein